MDSTISGTRLVISVSGRGNQGNPDTATRATGWAYRGDDDGVLRASSLTYFATAAISSGDSVFLNDFRSSALPTLFISTLTIESSLRLVMNALNVAIFEYFSFIVLGGVPRTPRHFRQFLFIEGFAVGGLRVRAPQTSGVHDEQQSERGADGNGHCFVSGFDRLGGGGGGAG